MQSALINLIAAIVRQLIGAEIWGLIVVAVTTQEAEAKSGEEKRAAVLKAAGAFAATSATWLINLAIETAVAKLKVAK